MPGRPLLLTCILALLTACGDGNATDSVQSGPGESTPVPGEADFTDRGVVLRPGTHAWESRWTYGTPGTVVKKDGTYFLYYVGASGDRADGGPAYRAVGAATSTDGRIWTKSPSNPVVPWSELNTHGDDEEGAWRLAAMLDEDGTVLLYVTELDGSGGTVNGSIALFVSSDGFDFSKRGVVADHAERDLPGSDEIGVLGAAREPGGGLYHLFYTGKGGGVMWDGVHTSSTSRDRFTSGVEVLDLGPEVRFGSNPIRLSDSEWLVPWGLFGGEIHVHRTSDLADSGTRAASWERLTEGNFALYLDEDRGEWLLLAADGEAARPVGLRLYTAPYR